MAESSIGWTDVVWNPLVGCSRLSAGCQNCYAEQLSYRLAAMGQGKYHGLTRKVGDAVRWTGEVRFVEGVLELPLKWKKPRRVFVNSMSDLFHEQVFDEWIDRILSVMAWTSQHTYLILTKRPERMRKYSVEMASLDRRSRGERVVRSMYRGHPAERIVTDGLGRDTQTGGFDWPLSNVHLGVSVENQETADERIPLLLQTPAAVRWISYEPSLGAVDLGLGRWIRLNHAVRTEIPFLSTTALTGVYRAESNPRGALSVRATDGRMLGVKPAEFDRLPSLDWVVIGAESGRDRRPFELDWLTSTVAQCRAAGTAIYVKQDSALRPGQQGRIPNDLWIHEFPKMNR